MIKSVSLYIIVLVSVLFIFCYRPSKRIYLTSMGDIKNSEVLKVKKIIENNYKKYNVTILPSINIITDSKIVGENRYNSEKILNTLEDLFSEKNGRVMVLTSVDICTDVKGYRKNQEILGASQTFGRFSVVSTHRMDRNDLLKKTVVHELGHSFGLTHCKSEYNCLMNCDVRHNKKRKKSAIYHVNDYFCENCINRLKYSSNFIRIYCSIL